MGRGRNFLCMGGMNPEHGLLMLSIYIFGLALLLLIASLGVSLREIQISTRALDIYLSTMEGKLKH